MFANTQHRWQHFIWGVGGSSYLTDKRRTDALVSFY